MKLLRRVPCALVWCRCLALLLAAGAKEAAAGDAAVVNAVTGTEKVATATPKGRQSYDAAFFQRFFPQTALDMLERLPGFTLDRGDDVRGFGGSAGNVLVDGARPSTKSLNLEGVLSRIPARAVRRIEVLQGAQKAGETAGQAVIANVIRDPSRTSGAWSVEAKREPDGLVYPVLELSLADTLAGWTTATQASYYWEEFDNQHFTRRLRAADGTLLLFQDESNVRKEYFGSLAVEAQRAVGEARLTLNGQLSLFDFANDIRRWGYQRRERGFAPDERLRIDRDERTERSEFGAVWDQPLADSWKFKAIGLLGLSRTDEETLAVDEAPLDTVNGTSLFASEAEQSELITRLTVGRGGRLAPEFGVEIARNEFDRSLALTRDSGSGAVSIALSNANAVVEELRGEAFSNLVWTLSPRFIAEFGLAGESSRLTVSGDADNGQRFSFLKPSLALNARLREGAQLRFALRRIVGQLNFGSFAASAQVDDARVLGGNPSLGPDQRTRASATLDLRSDRWGAFNVELFHSWIEDTLEQVVLPSGASGLANAGDARFWGATGSGYLPLNALLPGGLLELEFEAFGSEFDDPLTGETRDLTDFDTPNVDLTFRQDLVAQRWSWGLFYSFKTDTLDYFTNEISEGAFGEEWTAFVESTRWLNLKVRLQARFLKDRGFPRLRRFFAPDRSGAFAGSEQLERERGMFLSLQLSGQF